MNFGEVRKGQSVTWFKTICGGGFLKANRIPAQVLSVGKSRIQILAQAAGEDKPKARWVTCESLERKAKP